MKNYVTQDINSNKMKTKTLTQNELSLLQHIMNVYMEDNKRLYEENKYDPEGLTPLQKNKIVKKLGKKLITIYSDVNEKNNNSYFVDPFSNTIH